ncbi:MAG: molybdopterin-dependent oxidoreductase, partial [Rhodospirillales bacterium]|nr:molybdopterin-dependent oxidoreductase [Rhodospirillales bacterium]
VDTTATPVDAGSYGSRVTILAGQAAQEAARDVKRQLAEVAARMWKVEAYKILFNDRQVFLEGDPEKSMAFRKLTQIACYSASGAVIMGKGYSQYGIERNDFDTGYGNPGVSYSFTTQLSQVDVDTETGMVQAKDFLIAHDCGRPLHPVNVEAQCQGAASQGLGQAFYENFKMDKGRTLNPTMVNYMMPLSTEHPNFELVDIITDDPNGPFGAKEASEGSIISTPPSLVSAVHDATGLWITRLPVTPEKIVMGLRKNKPG